MWGGSLLARPGRDHGEDQRLDRLRTGSVCAGYRRAPWRMPTCLVAQGILTAKDCPCDQAGPGAGPRPRSRAASSSSRPSSRMIHFNVEARLTDIIGPAGGRLHTGRSANDQARRCAIVDARHGRPAGGDAARPAGSADRPRRGICLDHHAGLHPPADGAADHLRPSPARLCRDVRPRTAAAA